VPAAAGVGVEHEERGVLAQQGVQLGEQDAVLEHVGMVAGVEGVAVVHARSIAAAMGRDYAWPMPTAPLILIADDEPAIADTLLYALRSEGLQAELCLLAREALELVRARGLRGPVMGVGFTVLCRVDAL